MMFMLIGDVVLVVGAIRDVAINEQIRFPKIPQGQPGARLGRRGFHVIAIEILVSAGRAPAHFVGAVLVDTVVRADSFMTVGVVDGDKEYYQVFEQTGMRFGN